MLVCIYKKSQFYNCMFSVHLNNSDLQSNSINVDIGIKCDQDVACQRWTHNLQGFPLNTINNCQLHHFDKKHNIPHQMAPTTCVVVVAPTTNVLWATLQVTWIPYTYTLCFNSSRSPMYKWYKKFKKTVYRTLNFF